MGNLKFCLVRRWENSPDTYLMDLELEAWARTTWRLKGSLMVAFLNQDLLFLEFDIPEEAKWVFESGRSWFRGSSLNLEWWTPNSAYVKSKEEVKEAWIRVVGLPLHLWSYEVMKMIGDSCRGFLAIDKDTTLRTKVSWARVLVKLEGKYEGPSVVNILEGVRSFEIQIWWELPPCSIWVYLAKKRKEHLQEETEEEDEAITRSSKCAWFPLKENNDDGQKDMAEETADRVGKRWASSTEIQGVGRYSSFRKEFTGFGPRSTLPFGPAHLILSWRGWEKRDGPRPTKSLRKQMFRVGQSNGGPKEIVNPKGSLQGLNDPKKKFKGTVC